MLFLEGINVDCVFRSETVGRGGASALSGEFFVLFWRLSVDEFGWGKF